jgi:DNA invertase Pin-like site-specific DNA recombinase
MTTRRKNKGFFLLRRSGDRQETSLEKQLVWGITKAGEIGVSIDASIEDLRHMQADRLSRYKSIYLDDAIPGDEMDRPGLSALLRDAKANSSISHVFAFARDRLGRPESPVDAMLKEFDLLRAGVTLVYPERMITLPPSGQLDIADQLKMLLDYHNSGDFPRKLAEQMINTQRILAQQGMSIGGTPPYGFVRALVNCKGETVEILPSGKRVRQSGCHVQWMPDPEDATKLQVWIMMLTLKAQGFGFKRIANRLNSLGIPSPAAGARRTDHGQSHIIGRLWNHTTVKNLIENRMILALFDYGRRSEGKHRRLGLDGPRFLVTSDRNTDGRPKTIKNCPSLVMTKQLPFSAQFDAAQWDEIQRQTRARGKSQAGIPRVRDSAKYPLACRVYDLTDDCGSIMYGRTSGNRRMYTCGRYMKNGAAACQHNQVDADALLQFTMAALREIVDRMGARELLRKKLVDLASQNVDKTKDDSESQAQVLQDRISELERKKAVVKGNSLLVEDPELRAEAEKMFCELRSQIDGLQWERLRAEKSKSKSDEPNREIDNAMALLDDLRRVAVDDSSRAQVPGLFDRLGIKIGLHFVDATKKARHVRRLAGGVLAMGNANFTKGGGNNGDGEVPFRRGEKDLAAQLGQLPALASAHNKTPGEGISYTKVNRGDRIRTCGLLVPNQTLYQAELRPGFLA